MSIEIILTIVAPWLAFFGYVAVNRAKQRGVEIDKLNIEAKASEAVLTDLKETKQERDKSLQDINELRVELAEVRGILLKTQDEVATLKSEKLRNDKTINNLNEQINELRPRVNDLEQNLNTALGENAKLADKLHAANVKIEQKDKLIQEKDAELLRVVSEKDKQIVHLTGKVEMAELLFDKIAIKPVEAAESSERLPAQEGAGSSETPTEQNQ